MGVAMKSGRRAAVLTRHIRRSCASATVPRSAIVTGGSRGIGRAICEKLAREGFTVVVNYNKNAKAALEVVEAIKAHGGSAIALEGDMSSETEVTRFFKEVDSAKLPRLAALVNNAGVLIPGVDLEKIADEGLYHKQMSTNVLGPLLCCR